MWEDRSPKFSSVACLYEQSLIEGPVKLPDISELMMARTSRGYLESPS